MRKILKLYSKSVFLYDDKVYGQIDGGAMGTLISQLAPILANRFAASKENLQLSSTLKTEPVLYARYVDDIFVLMKNSSELNSFFYEMNNLHSNLQFTLERSTDNRLPSLDTVLKLMSNRLHTSVFRKPTDINLVIQYTSICPKAWKIDLLKFFLNSALNLYTNYVNFKEEP